MATTQPSNQGPSTAATIPNNIDRYVVIHVATTCDEHGVYVTKDSAEVIEIGWILIEAKSSEEVYIYTLGTRWRVEPELTSRTVAPGEYSGQARQHTHYTALQ
jgi:hypothetical protein